MAASVAIMNRRRKMREMRSLPVEKNEDQMVVKSLSIPPGLEALMEGLTKEVLKVQPQDICMFASDYFAKLIKLRKQTGAEYQYCKTSINKKNNLPQRLTLNQSHPKNEVEFINAGQLLSVPRLYLGKLKKEQDAKTITVPEIKNSRSEASTAEIDKIQNGFFKTANLLDKANISAIDFEMLAAEKDKERKLEGDETNDAISQVDDDKIGEIKIISDFNGEIEETELIALHNNEEIIETKVTEDGEMILEGDTEDTLTNRDDNDVIINTNDEKEHTIGKRSVSNENISKLDVPEISTTIATPLPSDEETEIDVKTENIDEHDETKEKKAAIKIQSIWRGFKARKNWELKLPTNENEASVIIPKATSDLINAATVIQSLWRGFSIRKTNKLEHTTEIAELTELKDEITNETAELAEIENNIIKEETEYINSEVSTEEAEENNDAIETLSEQIKDFNKTEDNVEEMTETVEHIMEENAEAEIIAEERDIITAKMTAEDIKEENIEADKNKSETIIAEAEGIIDTEITAEEFREENIEAEIINEVDANNPEITAEAEDIINAETIAKEIKEENIEADIINSEITTEAEDIINAENIVKDINEENIEGEIINSEITDEVESVINAEIIDEELKKEIIEAGIIAEAEINNLEIASEAEDVINSEIAGEEIKEENNEADVINSEITDEVESVINAEIIAEELKESIIETYVNHSEITNEAGDVINSEIIAEEIKEKNNDITDEAVSVINAEIIAEEVKEEDIEAEIIAKTNVNNSEIITEAEKVINSEITAEEIKEENEETDMINSENQKENIDTEVVTEAEDTTDTELTTNEIITIDEDKINAEIITEETNKQNVEAKIIAEAENIIKTEIASNLAIENESNETEIIDSGVVEESGFENDESEKPVTFILGAEDDDLDEHGDIKDHFQQKVIVEDIVDDAVKSAEDQIDIDTEQFKSTNELLEIVHDDSAISQMESMGHADIISDDTVDEAVEIDTGITDTEDTTAIDSLEYKTEIEIADEISDDLEKLKAWIADESSDNVLEENEILKEKSLLTLNTSESELEHLNISSSHSEDKNEEQIDETTKLKAAEEVIMKALGLQHSGEMHDSLDLPVIADVSNIEEPLLLQHSSEMHDSIDIPIVSTNHEIEQNYTVEEVEEEIKENLTRLKKQVGVDISEISDDNDDNLEEIKPELEEIVDETMADKIDDIEQSTLETAEGIITEFEETVADVTDNLVNGTQKTVNSVEDADSHLIDLQEDLEENIKEKATELGESITDLSNNANSILQNTLDFEFPNAEIQIDPKMKVEVDDLKEAENNIENEIVETVENIENNAQNMIDDANTEINELSTELTKNTENIKQEIEEVKEDIKDIAENVDEQISDVITDIPLEETIKNLKENIVENEKEVVDTAKENLEALSSEAENINELSAEHVVEAVKEDIQDVEQSVLEVAATIEELQKDTNEKEDVVLTETSVEIENNENLQINEEKIEIETNKDDNDENINKEIEEITTEDSNIKDSMQEIAEENENTLDIIDGENIKIEKDINEAIDEEAISLIEKIDNETTEEADINVDTLQSIADNILMETDVISKINTEKDEEEIQDIEAIVDKKVVVEELEEQTLNDNIQNESSNAELAENIENFNKALTETFNSDSVINNENDSDNININKTQSNEEVVSNKLDEDKAATKLQATWRGYNARRAQNDKEDILLSKPAECDELPHQRGEVNDDKNEDLIKKAATTIQSGVRGYLVRKKRHLLPENTDSLDNNPTEIVSEISEKELNNLSKEDHEEVKNTIIEHEAQIVADKTSYQTTKEEINTVEVEAIKDVENIETFSEEIRNEDDTSVEIVDEVPVIEIDNNKIIEADVITEEAIQNLEDANAEVKDVLDSENVIVSTNNILKDEANDTNSIENAKQETEDDIEALNLRLQNLQKTNIYENNLSSENEAINLVDTTRSNDSLNSDCENKEVEEILKHQSLTSSPNAVDLDNFGSSKYDLKSDYLSPRSKNVSPMEELLTSAFKLGARLSVNDDKIVDAIDPKGDLEEKAVQYILIPLQGPIPVTEEPIKKEYVSPRILKDESVIVRGNDEDSPEYIYIPLKDPGSSTSERLDDSIGLLHSGEMHDSLGFLHEENEDTKVGDDFKNDDKGGLLHSGEMHDSLVLPEDVQQSKIDDEGVTGLQHSGEMHDLIDTNIELINEEFSDKKSNDIKLSDNESLIVQKFEEENEALDSSLELSKENILIKEEEELPISEEITIKEHQLTDVNASNYIPENKIEEDITTELNSENMQLTLQKNTSNAIINDFALMQHADLIETIDSQAIQPDDNIIDINMHEEISTNHVDNIFTSNDESSISNNNEEANAQEDQLVDAANDLLINISDQNDKVNKIEDEESITTEINETKNVEIHSDQYDEDNSNNNETQTEINENSGNNAISESIEENVAGADIIEENTIVKEILVPSVAEVIKSENLSASIEDANNDKEISENENQGDNVLKEAHEKIVAIEEISENTEGRILSEIEDQIEVDETVNEEPIKKKEEKIETENETSNINEDVKETDILKDDENVHDYEVITTDLAEKDIEGTNNINKAVVDETNKEGNSFEEEISLIETKEGSLKEENKYSDNNEQSNETIDNENAINETNINEKEETKPFNADDTQLEELQIIQNNNNTNSENVEETTLLVTDVEINSTETATNLSGNEIDDNESTFVDKNVASLETNEIILPKLEEVRDLKETTMNENIFREGVDTTLEADQNENDSKSALLHSGELHDSLVLPEDVKQSENIDAGITGLQHSGEMHDMVDISAETINLSDNISSTIENEDSMVQNFEEKEALDNTLDLSKENNLIQNEDTPINEVIVNAAEVVLPEIESQIVSEEINTNENTSAIVTHQNEDIHMHENEIANETGEEVTVSSIEEQIVAEEIKEDGSNSNNENILIVGNEEFKVTDTRTEDPKDKINSEEIIKEEANVSEASNEEEDTNMIDTSINLEKTEIASNTEITEIKETVLVESDDHINIEEIHIDETTKDDTAQDLSGNNHLENETVVHQVNGEQITDNTEQNTIEDVKIDGNILQPNDEEQNDNISIEVTHNVEDQNIGAPNNVDSLENDIEVVEVNKIIIDENTEDVDEGNAGKEVSKSEIDVSEADNETSTEQVDDKETEQEETNINDEKSNDGVTIDITDEETIIPTNEKLLDTVDGIISNPDAAAITVTKEIVNESNDNDAEANVGDTVTEKEILTLGEAHSVQENTEGNIYKKEYTEETIAAGEEAIGDAEKATTGTKEEIIVSDSQEQTDIDISEAENKTSNNEINSTDIITESETISHEISATENANDPIKGIIEQDKENEIEETITTNGNKIDAGKTADNVVITNENKEENDIITNEEDRNITTTVTEKEDEVVLEIKHENTETLSTSEKIIEVVEDKNDNNDAINSKITTDSSDENLAENEEENTEQNKSNETLNGNDAINTKKEDIQENKDNEVVNKANGDQTEINKDIDDKISKENNKLQVTNLMDIENIAANTIQHAYRGYRTRRDINKQNNNNEEHIVSTIPDIPKSNIKKGNEEKIDQQTGIEENNDIHKEEIVNTNLSVYKDDGNIDISSNNQIILEEGKDIDTNQENSTEKEEIGANSSSERINENDITSHIVQPNDVKTSVTKDEHTGQNEDNDKTELQYTEKKENYLKGTENTVPEEAAEDKIETNELSTNEQNCSSVTDVENTSKEVSQRISSPITPTNSPINDIDAFLERRKSSPRSASRSSNSPSTRQLFNEIDSLIESYGHKRRMSPTENGKFDLESPKIDSFETPKFERNLSMDTNSIELGQTSPDSAKNISNEESDKISGEEDILSNDKKEDTHEEPVRQDPKETISSELNTEEDEKEEVQSDLDKSKHINEVNQNLYEHAEKQEQSDVDKEHNNGHELDKQEIDNISELTETEESVTKDEIGKSEEHNMHNFEIKDQKEEDVDDNAGIHEIHDKKENVAIHEVPEEQTELVKQEEMEKHRKQSETDNIDSKLNQQNMNIPEIENQKVHYSEHEETEVHAKEDTENDDLKPEENNAKTQESDDLSQNTESDVNDNKEQSENNNTESENNTLPEQHKQNIQNAETGKQVIENEIQNDDNKGDLIENTESDDVSSNCEKLMNNEDIQDQQSSKIEENKNIEDEINKNEDDNKNELDAEIENTANNGQVDEDNIQKEHSSTIEAEIHGNEDKTGHENELDEPHNAHIEANLNASDNGQANEDKMKKEHCDTIKEDTADETQEDNKLNSEDNKDHANNLINLENTAAKTIQNAYRGYLTRRDTNSQTLSIEKPQERKNSTETNKTYTIEAVSSPDDISSDEENIKSAAASKIQSSFRNYQAKRSLSLNDAPNHETKSQTQNNEDHHLKINELEDKLLASPVRDGNFHDAQTEELKDFSEISHCDAQTQNSNRSFKTWHSLDNSALNSIPEDASDIKLDLKSASPRENTEEETARIDEEHDIYMSPELKSNKTSLDDDDDDTDTKLKENESLLNSGKLETIPESISPALCLQNKEEPQPNGQEKNPTKTDFLNIENESKTNTTSDETFFQNNSENITSDSSMENSHSRGSIDKSMDMDQNLDHDEYELDSGFARDYITDGEEAEVETSGIQSEDSIYDGDESDAKTSPDDNLGQGRRRKSKMDTGDYEEGKRVVPLEHSSDINNDTLDIFLSSEELSQGAEMLTSREDLLNTSNNSRQQEQEEKKCQEENIRCDAQSRTERRNVAGDDIRSDMETAGNSQTTAAKSLQQTPAQKFTTDSNMGEGKEDTSEQLAATKIQAGFRGYQVRKQMKTKKPSSDNNKEIKRSSGRRRNSGRAKDVQKSSSDLEERSATKIQAGIRGFLVRKRQTKTKDQQA